MGALVIHPGSTYHFYRRDSNGRWSHKDGLTKAKNYDAKGNLIYSINYYGDIMSNIMEIEDILKILPHRYPFMLVDRIIEQSDDGNRIVGLKNLTFNELFFQGHFPDNPVMPGVLQLEAMAQVAGVLLNSRSGNEGRIAYFMSIGNAKFRKVVKPGDQLIIEVETVRMRSRMAVVKGKAFVRDNLVSEAELSFGYGAD